MNNTYLVHHGIKGQQWGVQNGPPYPLGAEQKSKKELHGAKSKSKQSINDANPYDPRSEYYTDAKAKRTDAVLTSVLGLISFNPILLGKGISDLAKDVTANARAEKFIKERKNLKIDTKTGFALKEKEYTEEEDLKRVNPAFKNLDSNTKWNCMLCTATYDLRRKGYDVTAKTSGTGFGPEDIKTWYPKAKINHLVPIVEPPKNSKPSGMKDWEKRKTDEGIRLFTETVLKQGEGARGNLMVKFSALHSGHSIIYEVKDGNIRLLDGQSDKIYSNPNKFLSRTSGEYYVTRYDNVAFDVDNIKRCCH